MAFWWKVGPGTDDTSLGHMIREFSPKAVFLPPCIRIILILATFPRLQVQGGGEKTFHRTEDFDSLTHSSLSCSLEGDITGSVDE